MKSVFVLISAITLLFWTIVNFENPGRILVQNSVENQETFEPVFILEQVVVRKMLVEATAYSPPLFPRGQLSFTEDPVGHGVIAVDPKVIPLYSKIKIQGFDGLFFALDTGRLTKGEKIDIWMPSLREAKEWGRRKISIKIIM